MARVCATEDVRRGADAESAKGGSGDGVTLGKTDSRCGKRGELYAKADVAASADLNGTTVMACRACG
jgi:hypothetical protein